MQKQSLITSTRQATVQHGASKLHHKLELALQSYCYKHIALLILTALMILGSTVIYAYQQTVFASGKGCTWHTVHSGDTLSGIARRTGATVWTLVHVNHIANANVILIGQRLCIPYSQQSSRPGNLPASSMLPNGVIRWYAYNALEWSTRGQVTSMLRRAAVHYRLPVNLLLAIAWQESGWYQHVIAHDGGIGVMQLMPYTAMSINAATGTRRDPYHLWDNINLGATYLSWLWRSFHGNLPRVISAYNEGSWAVMHRGIFNWRYVRNVLSLMRVYR
jgi:hypothetical protein